MRDSLEAHYENELNFIRRLGQEFARDRPKIADRLLLDRETGEAADPHVERLIESFAFLTARIQQKLSDDYPELTSALLGVLYPHYLAPIPSMAIAQFELDADRGKLTTGYTIPRHSVLNSRPVETLPCRFQTAYPVTLWPLELESASYVTAPFGSLLTVPCEMSGVTSALRLRLKSLGGVPLHEMQLDRLRFFLSGDERTTRTIHELLLNHAQAYILQGTTQNGKSVSTTLSTKQLQPVGFEKDQGLLPYDARSFLGYRLLTEYFAFPAKFMFVDFLGLDAISSSQLRDSFDLVVLLNHTAAELETRVKKETFRLGCTPIVNTFKQEADPIRLTRTKYEYHVIPDVRHVRRLEVYSVDRVYSTNLATRESVEYRPFYSVKHPDIDVSQDVFWHIVRRPSMAKGDSGTDVYLSLADLTYSPRLPSTEVLSLETTCTNRDLPGLLRAAGGERWQFDLEGQAPLRRIVPLVGPTLPLRMPSSQQQWRLISHLSLNHLSISGAGDGAESLREILRLYDFADNKVSASHIAGLMRVNCRRGVAPVRDGVTHGFARGTEITIEFDETKYAGTGVFLLASILERFLALYSSINSATRLIAQSQSAGGFYKRWPYRVGERFPL